MYIGYLHRKRIKDEFLIIYTNVQDSKQAFEIYKKRWDIERLFKNMKSQGLNLEKTHMKNLKRLFLLMFLVTVALFVSYLAGIFQKTTFKKTVFSQLYSIFTRGIRAIKRNLRLDFTEITATFQKSEG